MSNYYFHFQYNLGYINIAKNSSTSITPYLKQAGFKIIQPEDIPADQEDLPFFYILRNPIDRFCSGIVETYCNSADSWGTSKTATVTYEALAHGLPVICTPNTGSIVADGETGLIVEPFSAVAIAEALGRLIDEPDLVPTLSETARARRAAASIDRYETDLLRVFRDRMAQKAPMPSTVATDKETRDATA